MSIPYDPEAGYRFHHQLAGAFEALMLVGVLTGMLGVGIILTQIEQQHDMLHFLTNEDLGQVASVATLLSIMFFVWGFSESRPHRSNQHFESKH